MGILKSDRIQPSLQPAQINRVLDAQELLERQNAHAENGQSSDQSDEEDLHNDDDKYSESEASSVSDDSRPPFYRSSTKKSLIQLTSEQTNLVRCLQQFLATQLRIRDKERMIGLVFQGVTGEILRELISIFYEPLLEVYKAANVADSLMDLKDFLDELIKIVEQADVADGRARSLLPRQRKIKKQI
jgi:hypothetical protein